MWNKLVLGIGICMFIYACSSTSDQKGENNSSTTTDKPDQPTEEIVKADHCQNDSLNALVNITAGILDSDNLFQWVKETEDFKTFQSSFEEKWQTFSDTRIKKLEEFKKAEIDELVKPQKTLFYPFSGPDILYAQTFFPEAERYVMLGLEPVGSLPNFKENADLKAYFSLVNSSLHAILNYSFFRTKSMHNDLRNDKVDGTLHLLTLFLKRKGNTLCSVTPIAIDSVGGIVKYAHFDQLRKLTDQTPGVEIKFIDKDKKQKSLYYFSLNAADGALATNKGFVTYINSLGDVNTYLKGASYLMHKSYFSHVRNAILKQSHHVIQDDSGIALRYFEKDNNDWQYNFFGQYTKPINLFSNHYQKDLDSLYKQHGSKHIGFGIGYNFMDKNSNFMVITKK